MSGGTSREGMKFDYGTHWRGGPVLVTSLGRTTISISLPAEQWRGMNEGARSAWRKHAYARAEHMLGIRRGSAR